MSYYLINRNSGLIKLTLILLISLSPYSVLQAKTPSAEHKSQCFQIVNTADKFKNEQYEERFRSILRVARCVKCANQSLESSQAGLANDLRMQICLKVLDNMSTPKIKQYLVGSYGEYILYDPSFKPGNYALWFLPLILLVIGFGVLFSKIKSRTPTINEEITASEQSKLQDLLLDNNEDRK